MITNTKLAKDEVQYSPGKGRDRCFFCTHFEKPNHCELVAGLIREDYWCNRFEKKRG